MGYLSTTLSGMDSASVAMIEAWDIANRGAGDIAAEVEALGNAWTGEASIAYQKALNTWMENARVVRDALQGMIEVMGLSARAVQATESGATDDVSTLGGIIDGSVTVTL